LKSMRMITWFILLFCPGVIMADSADLLMQETVTLHCTAMPLREVLHEISNQIPASFVYNDLLVENISISYHVENGLLKDVLTYLIPGQKISYRLIEEKLIVLFPNMTDIRQSERTINRFEEPELIKKSKPAYPVSAIRQNASGIVSLYLHITHKGNVDSVRLKCSSGFSLLDSTAIDYATTLQFKPALSNNKPVSIWMKWDFDFQLGDEHGNSVANSR